MVVKFWSPDENPIDVVADGTHRCISQINELSLRAAQVHCDALVIDKNKTETASGAFIVEIMRAIISFWDYGTQIWVSMSQLYLMIFSNNLFSKPLSQPLFWPRK